MDISSQLRNIIFPFSASPEGTVIYTGKTDLYTAKIIDNPKEDSRKLYLDIQLASGMKLSNGGLFFKYTLLGQLAYLSLPKISRALFIGLGGGTEIKHFLRAHKRAQVEIAEIDSQLLPLAQKFFGFPADDKRISLHLRDGLAHLASSTSTYDFIRLDAFDFGTFVPRRLLSLESTSIMRSRLSDNGLLAANLVSPLEGPHSALFRAFYKTLGAAFPSLAVFCTAPDTPETAQNIALFASPSASRPLSLERILKGVSAPQHIELHQLANECIWRKPVETGDVQIIMS